MALNRRQTLLYQHRMRTYRKTRNAAGDWVYQVHISSAPCYFFVTTNADAPRGGSLNKQDNLFTYDNVHFEAGLDVDGQDIIENITEGAVEKNNFFKLMGEPDIHQATTRRNTNYAHAYLNKTNDVPKVGVG